MQAYANDLRCSLAVGSVPCHYGTYVILLDAVGVADLQALMAVNRAADGGVLRACVEQVLDLTLCAGDMVVRDNLRTYNMVGIWEALGYYPNLPMGLTASNSDRLGFYLWRRT
jgi:hypothetical protein